MKIDHINKNTSKNGKVHYHVFYKSGRKHTVFEDRLTNEMIDIILNGVCETAYYETGKVERFTKA